MTNITRSDFTKQAEIKMIDGSRLLYHIDITIQTENKDLSHAYQNIKTQSTAELLEPIEQLLVERLRRYEYDREPTEESIENKSKDTGLIDPCPWCQSKLFLVRDKSDYFTQCENCEFEIEHDAEEINEMLKVGLKAKYADRDDEDGEDSID
jgi:hypothetical protein